MAPPGAARSRSRSRSQSQPPSEASVAAAIKLFKDQLKFAKKEGNQILLSNEVLGPVNDIMRARGARRGNDTSFQPRLVTDIIFELDDEVCSHLEVPVYNTLLRLFLNTTECPDVERGLYLLAATLYRDAHLSSSPMPEEDVESIKTEIGRDSLQPLLEFFTNAGNPVDLRRWAGILLIQLFHGSDKNVQSLELGSEDARRNLGNMLSIEENDCLIIICGQVIKELVDAGVSKDILWPMGTKESVYQKFPDSSQAGRWNQRFQTYLDNSDPSPNSDTYLYFAQNVCTTPPSNSERPGHTTYIVTDSQTLTLWSPASGSEFDQFVDISLRDLSTMTITSTGKSQRPSETVTIDFGIDNDEDKLSLLNAASIILNKVSMMVLTTDADHMKEDLSNLCTELEIREINNATKEASNVDRRELESQINVTSSTADTPVVFREGEAETFETTISTSRKVPREHNKKDQLSASKDSSEDDLEAGETRQHTNYMQPTMEDPTATPPSSYPAQRRRGADLPYDKRKLEQIPSPAGGLLSRENNCQMKPDSATSQSSSKEQKRVAAASDRRARALLVPNQKGTNANGKVPSDNVKLASASNVVETRQKAKTVKEASHHGQPSNQTLEEKIEKLSQVFPSESRAVIVGALTIAGGNLEVATNQILNGGQSVAESGEAGASKPSAEGISSFNKAEEQFDSASFTSPDSNDASTPKPNKPSGKANLAASKKPTTKAEAKTQQTTKAPTQVALKAASKPAKYALKPKQPLTAATSTKPPAKNQERPKPAEKPKLVEKAKPPRIPIVEGKKPAEKPKASGSYLWDIDPTDDEDEQVIPQSSKGKKGVVKSSTKASAKKAPATTNKSSKPAKTVPKKRQSAPAVLEKTAAASRSKRGAAIEASKKLHKAAVSDDGIEDAEDIVKVKDVQNTRKGKSATGQKPLQPVPKPKYHDAEAVTPPSPERIDDSVGFQRDDAIDTGPSDTSLVNIRPASEADASKKRPVKKAAQKIPQHSIGNTAVGSKKEPRTVNYFSSKLGGMLGEISIHDIEDKISPECDDYPRKQLKGNGNPDITHKDNSYRVSDAFQKQKISKSVGVPDTVSLTPNEKLHPKDQKLLDGSHNETVPKGSAIRNDEGDGAAAGPTETPDDVSGISHGQDSPAHEAPTVFNDKHTRQDRGVADKALVSEQVSDHSKSSTPVAPMNAKKAVSDIVRKRKAVDYVQTSAKRRDSAEGAIQAGNDASTRQSQRLETRAKAASEALNERLSNTPLVDDRLSRKTQIVNFGAHGAMNQGPSSILRSSAIKEPNQEPIKTAESPVGKKMKRTREDLNESNAHIQIPGRPKKRQNISLEDNQEDLQVTNENHIADDNHVDYSSSLPAGHHQIIRNSKPSSQASRVDRNGSPRALVSAEKVDHFSKVTQKLLQDQQAEDSKKERTLNTNQIFGRRPRLASIPKTGPSSPQNIEARYVKLQRIGNDQYEGVETKEVVVPEKPLADPFVGGPARRSSGFTERLQAGSAKENLKLETIQQPKERASAPTQDQTASNAVDNPTKAAIQERNGRLTQKLVPVYDEQITLVNSDTELPSSPNDLSSGSTIDDDMSPLSDGGNSAWNLALRPHYGDLFTVAHRLVDEVLIRLEKTEDVMGLLVTQYKENGSTLMGHLVGQRDKEKARIVADLEQQKKEMVCVYDEAKTFVNDAEKALKSSALHIFEKQWRKEQEDIQRMIDAGRKALQ